ncbi:MAG: NTP transferase domain-containing protein, partial [Planctomycetes bacterium]|nr:NTP transferase domain-containing protein [Planctomycetota bacterium]
MATLQACVLAAGKGARMGGDRPKVLFEAGGKPLIEWVLGALSDAGVNDCVVVVGYRKDEVVAKLPTGVRWVEQSPQLGTGHAVRCARSSFHTHETKEILVTYGDMPLVSAVTYLRLVELKRKEDAEAVILTCSIRPESRFGRVIRNLDGGVRRIVEYKDAAPEERAAPEGNAGVYCFKPPALWEALEKIGNDNAQGEYYLPDVIPIILADGGKVVAAR